MLLIKFQNAGVAVGAGWQLQVALISIGCYYGFGLPLGALLGYKFKFGVEGILSAMLAGSLLQTLFQFFIIARTSWHKQVILTFFIVILCAPRQFH